uniref:Uncharacterized protein n=1 Tax=Triticum urartu TaxID=4572 RepID=A0A8R7PQU8_TRIUA
LARRSSPVTEASRNLTSRRGCAPAFSRRPPSQRALRAPASHTATHCTGRERLAGLELRIALRCWVVAESWSRRGERI